MAHNGLRYEHVAGFGALLYQTTPKLDVRMKVKKPQTPPLLMSAC